MRRTALTAFIALLFAAVLGASDARAATIGGNPGPQ